ncbi:hypothetical protein PFICI_04704 [Pestalotiopsis fici W106-1]|uniref:LysM domain-containing protein n=1 Tax=Pestalotiopsis fici (strain W106-1 / CGMCC3.15140) TaxID=1229662 RepID=W3X9P1_PESFW|nr:uncharacterized protein PFICI_04704 [Pestalotiopsis fici W106-1]ETS82828.1 hypothetical protein PFICI_04704 [Pestalotiopsis fici W106-1]
MSTRVGSSLRSSTLRIAAPWLLLMAPGCLGIQLFDSTSAVPSSIPADCATALTANITCEVLVSAASVSNQQYIDVATLDSLCTTTCSQSLLSFQQDVESTCGSAPYAFDETRNQTISSVVDPLVWAYNVACLSSSNTFCYPAVLNASSGLTECSDCLLQYEAAMLNSDYGRVRFDPDSFSTQLSSCGIAATSYPYTDPPATSTTATGTSTTTAPTQTCTGTSYVVQSSDTCGSIAQANSIATDRFLSENSLDYNCTTLKTGNTVCLGASCALYEVQPNDTCDSILADETFYLTQLLSWNPTIYADCSNLDSMVGREICISPPGSTTWDVQPQNITTSWNVTFVMPTTVFTTLPEQTSVPTYNTTYLAPTTPINITTITATADPTAIESYVSLLVYCPISYNDTMDGWTIPDLPDTCADALSSYCQPPADATMPPSTSFDATCYPSYWDNLATATGTSVATTTTTSGPPGPTQTGVASDCDAWYVVQDNDSCSGIVEMYGNFTLDQFYSWNPAVGSSCQYLGVGYAVCIGISDGSTSSTTGTTISATATTTTSSAPSPIMPSTDPSCTSYYYVQNGDSCYDIEQEYDITADEFNKWNPYIGSDCANLWASEYICVGAPATGTPSTAMTATQTATSTATAPSPLEPSTVSDCTAYHYVVSGDSCFDIEQQYDITADQVKAPVPMILFAMWEETDRV